MLIIYKTQVGRALLHFLSFRVNGLIGGTTSFTSSNLPTKESTESQKMEKETVFWRLIFLVSLQNERISEPGQEDQSSRKSMASCGRFFRQTILTGKRLKILNQWMTQITLLMLLIQVVFRTDSFSSDDFTRLKKGRGKTRGKGLEKMKKTLGSKMKIEIPLGKGRPTKPDQSAKLSNELGIIARNFLLLPNKWKELTREDKDAALIRCHNKNLITNS
ncbi:hypothetical protein H5410_045366 [Solanum commersonii]|uniref:Uncharacterized protein n=1 Tax=Solanum commersonii TaxID=4109 RepID=A0A9J5XCJ0_SOLCO|nr:hypothetical protein H5410_045366 [Solanum commersonii]